MKKILVIGNSHTASLKLGHDALRDKISNGIEFKFSGVGNPILERWKLVNSIVYPVNDRRSGNDSSYSIENYNLIIVCAGYSASDPRLLYSKNIQPLSKNILLEIVKSCEDPLFQHSKHSPIIKSLLNNSECSNNILLVGSPYPSSELYDNFIGEVPLKDFRQSLRGFYAGLESDLMDDSVRIHKKIVLLLFLYATLWQHKILG